MGEVVIAALWIAVGGAGGFFLKKYLMDRQLDGAQQLASRILDEAKKEAQAQKKEILVQAEAEALARKKEAEQDVKDRERELKKNEARLQAKEERLDQKVEQLAQRESELGVLEKRLLQQEKDLEAKEQRLAELVAEQQRKLEEISGLTAEEARARFMEEVESKARHEAARMIRQIEAEAQETAHRKAQMIIATAVQRYASDYVAEHTVSAVELPSEDMKGRIIGREGRNIRALEAATGVDLIIDDTPETVVLSAFSPLRREIAKRSLERLISDGRIHPARIEEIVKKVEKEMEAHVREVGEQATFDLGVHGIHPELVKLLGQLRFRTSFTQNVLQHSIEVGFLCGIMAAELGMDVKKARRAGLLHDIGKAVDHEVEGTHAVIGADLARKYNEPGDVVHAIAAHHEDVPLKSVLAVLVQAADALSGARPGARKELLESYVKRLEELEQIATGFPGVTRAYAIQAGREVRVMVDCDQVNDDGVYFLSKDIAKQIEEKMTYPGQIRVTVIREKRAVGVAK